MSPSATVRLHPILLALALATCSSPQAELAKQAPATLVGMPKAALLSCAGVPQRSTVMTGGSELLTYQRQQTTVRREVEYEPSLLSRRLGVPIVQPYVWENRSTYRCEATFRIRNNLVEALDYNSDRDISLCYAILANCLGPNAESPPR